MISSYGSLNIKKHILISIVLSEEILFSYLMNNWQNPKVGNPDEGIKQNLHSGRARVGADFSVILDRNPNICGGYPVEDGDINQLTKMETEI
jgi:hypothetical protein